MKATRFVLDALRFGPIPLDTLFADAADAGLTESEVSQAAVRLNAMTCIRRRDGVRCMALHDNLAAIWWSNKPHAHRFYGNAA